MGGGGGSKQLTMSPGGVKFLLDLLEGGGGGVRATPLATPLNVYLHRVRITYRPTVPTNRATFAYSSTG